MVVVHCLVVVVVIKGEFALLLVLVSELVNALTSVGVGFQEFRWKFLIDGVFLNPFWNAARIEAVAALADSILVAEYVDDATDGARK